MTTTHTPESLAALARGFQETRVFLTAAELDLFTLLADGPLSLEEAAAARGASPRALAILLDALAATGLLEKEGGKWRTPAALVPFLSSRGERSLLPLALHSVNLWDRWSRLTEVVAGPRPGAGDREASTRAFIGAMNVIAAPQADGIVGVVEPGAARRLLDVGGGPATYTLAFVRAVPGLRATLFDLPSVVEMARENVAAAGLLDRVDLVAGDLRTDPLPGGHDLAFVSAIVHMLGPSGNVALFRKVHDALVPGGRIVLRDHVMSPDRTAPRAGALFAVNMLVGTEEGGTFTFEELAGWLAEAGFERARLVRGGERMDALVEAFRPG
ncbi:MAG: methyltransferase [Thermoanaerobaculia bacterium]